MTATTLQSSPLRSRAAAKPAAAEIEVDACAAPNGSYSLSGTLGEAGEAAGLRSVRMCLRRPVSILCG